MEDLFENLSLTSFSTEDLLRLLYLLVSVSALLFFGIRLVYYIDDPFMEFEKFIARGGERSDNDAFVRFVARRKLQYFLAFVASLLALIFFYILFVRGWISQAALWVGDFF